MSNSHSGLRSDVHLIYVNRRAAAAVLIHSTFRSRLKLRPHIVIRSLRIHSSEWSAPMPSRAEPKTRGLRASARHGVSARQYVTDLGREFAK